MKYMVLIAGSEDDRAAIPEADRMQAYAQIRTWWDQESAAGRIVEGYELQPTETATTVRRDPTGNLTVTDGPFVEAKESVGGYAIIDVADLDEAISLVSGWPSEATLEIRPILER
jgi:hypothetical protein